VISEQELATAIVFANNRQGHESKIVVCDIKGDGVVHALANELHDFPMTGSSSKPHVVSAALCVPLPTRTG